MFARVSGPGVCEDAEVCGHVYVLTYGVSPDYNYVGPTFTVLYHLPVSELLGDALVRTNDC